MNDPLLVRGFERVGDLTRDGQCLIERNRAARDALRQVLAFDEFHDQRTDAIRFFQSVDMRDVRMIERCERLGFACESGESVGVIGERIREDLQRDVAIEFRVTRPIHLPHPAFADLGGDFVDAETGTGCEGHRKWLRL
jgi:hypothetical protein